MRGSSFVEREVHNRSAMKHEASGCLTVSDSLQQECDALQMASDLLNMGREVLGLVGREAPITMSDRNDLSTGASDSLNLVIFLSGVTALACRLFADIRNTISPVYPTSRSSCTEATDSILCQDSQDLLGAGVTRRASHIDSLYAHQWGHHHEAWAPDFFMAVWGYAGCIDYRDTKILSCYDTQLRQDNRIPRRLTELNLTSLQGSNPFPTTTTPQPTATKFITPALNTMLRRQVKRMKPGHGGVRSDVIDRVPMWMTNAGMSVTVDALGCPNFQVFSQTWTDPQQSLSNPWNGETMWLHPPEHLWSRVAVEMIMEACRGVAIMPVVKEASCWWLVREGAVDSAEIPTGHPLFVTSHGKVKNCTIPYGVVLFDSFGHDRAQQLGPSQPGIRPEAVCNGWTEPSVDSQFH